MATAARATGQVPHMDQDHLHTVAEEEPLDRATTMAVEVTAAVEAIPDTGAEDTMMAEDAEHMTTAAEATKVVVIDR